MHRLLMQVVIVVSFVLLVLLGPAVVAKSEAAGWKVLTNHHPHAPITCARVINVSATAAGPHLMHRAGTADSWTPPTSCTHHTLPASPLLLLLLAPI